MPGGSNSIYRERRGPKCKLKRGNAEGLDLAIMGKLAGVYKEHLKLPRASTAFQTEKHERKKRERQHAREACGGGPRGPARVASAFAGLRGVSP